MTGTGPSQTVNAGVVILGGGVAALWTAHALRRAGHDVALLSNTDLGVGQTLAAQGVIHGGLKYALAGKLTDSSEALADMPDRWRRSLSGDGEIDLHDVSILSETQILWSLPQVVSKVVAFFGSQALRNRAGSLARKDFPPPFDSPLYRGHLFELGEMVVDPVGLVASLAKGLRDQIWKWPGQAEWRRDESGNITEAIFPDETGQLVTLRAGQWILAAGAGNGALLQAMGRTSPAMQLRPLHQVVIRAEALTSLYSVCIGTGPKPPVVTTTHTSSDGRRLWYAGGDLAESGVGRSPSAQIDFARDRFAEWLPWLDLRKAEWATVRVDRAEPATGTGDRPPGAFVDRRQNVTTVWPTKLALAPNLADQVVASLGNPEASSSPASGIGLQTLRLPRPGIGKAPWDL
jgi:glycine/D-amino acid oxidase-like deaminating enzyme